jgi:PAS domain S-box-containing protein
MVKQKAREMIQGKDSSPFKFRMVTKTGMIRSILQIVSPIQYDGQPAILGNAIDVTERTQAEEALRESERRLMDIIDFLPDATLAIDRQGKVIAWNRAMEEMTGLKAEDILGKGDYEYALPFYGEKRPILIDQVLVTEMNYHTVPEKQKDLLIVETWVPSLRGKKAFLWAKATPLYNSKGEVVGAIESMRDITSRKESEKLLQESEEKYRSLASTIDLMYLVDRDCRYLFMNEGHLSRIGKALNEMEGRYYRDFHTEEDSKEFSEIVKQVFDTGQSIQQEHRSSRDGRYFLRTMSPVKDSEGKTAVVTVISKDITIRKQTEEALRESERRLADIIDFLPDATLAIDLQGKVIAWNRAIEEMTGVKAEDMLDKENYEYALPFYGVRRPILIDLVLKPDKKIEQSYYSILEKEKDLLIVETWVPFLKWKKAFLWAKASPLYNSKGEIVGAIESIRDITERERLEELQRISEEKYRQLFATVPDAIFIFDSDTRQVIDVNESGLKLYGYTREEFLNLKYADVTAQPEESEKAIEEILIQKAKIILLRYHRKMDNTIFPVEISASMFYLEAQKVICLAIRDITERVRAEEAIRESEERYRTLFESTANPIVVIDTGGNYISCNNAALEFFQCPQDDLLSKNILNFIPPNKKRHDIEIHKSLWKTGGSVETEYYIGGNVKFMEMTITPTVWKGKNVVLGIGKDITKRKQAEEALRESERRLADIIDFLPDATLAIDRQGKIIAWNHAIEEMTGVKTEEILGRGGYEYAEPFYGERRPILIDLVLKPDKKIEQSYYSFLEKQKDLLIVETWVPHLKGERAFLWAKASPLYDSKGDIVGAIESIRDITARKQAEEALEKREMELEAKTNELEDLNAALRVLLKQREEDRNELEEKVLSNVKVLILPQMEKLKNHMDLKGMSYANVLESNLKDIISPFAKKLSVKYLNLTNREVEVANLIKEGKTTKEIASFLNVSESAVNVYRYHIRRKLNLSKKHNLRSYLSSLI